MIGTNLKPDFARVRRDRDSFDCYEYNDCYSTWNAWGRWAALAVVIVFFLIVVICCGFITSRRRRRAGVQPLYGTAWMAPPKYTPHDVHQFQTYPPQHYPPPGPPPGVSYYAPAPPYSPNGGQAGMYYHNPGVSTTHEQTHQQVGQEGLRGPNPVVVHGGQGQGPIMGHQTGETVPTHSTGSNNPYYPPPSGVPAVHIGGKM